MSPEEFLKDRFSSLDRKSLTTLKCFTFQCDIEVMILHILLAFQLDQLFINHEVTVIYQHKIPCLSNLLNLLSPDPQIG